MPSDTDTIRVLGFWVAALGYVIAIVAAVMLFQNSPRDLPRGRLPVLGSGEVAAFAQAEDEGIARRKQGSRRGFLLLVGGSILQLIGHLLAGFPT